jgi:hypothetical protein
VAESIELATEAIKAGGLEPTPIMPVSAPSVNTPALRGTGVPAGMTYSELINSPDAIAIVGHTLEKNRDNLIGVPFVITGVTVRDGVPAKNGKEVTLTNYLSLECVVADQATLTQMARMGRLLPAQLNNLIPNELIVINDGSTGIARQVIALLHQVGRIQVPEGDEGGEDGASRYDVHRTKWLRGFNPDVYDTEFKIIIQCPRGLRKSEYTNAFAADGAVTYYLA